MLLLSPFLAPKHTDPAILNRPGSSLPQFYPCSNFSFKSLLFFQVFTRFVPCFIWLVLTRHLHGQDSRLARSLIIPSSLTATSVSSLVILFLTAFVGIQNEYYRSHSFAGLCLSLPLENKLHKGPQKFVLHVIVCALLDRTLLHTKGLSIFLWWLRKGGMGVGESFKKKGYVLYLWLIHVVVQQTLTQHCKQLYSKR